MKSFALLQARSCFFFLQRLFFAWRRRKIECDTRSLPVLGIGDILNNKRCIHGGAVKLLALRDAFPLNEKKYNLLYLVSSAQPPCAQDLVIKARQAGVSFVWNQNGVGYPAWAGSKVERYNAPMRYLRSLADYVIYQSAFCRDSAEHFLGSYAGPSEILFNPIDLKKFSPASKRPPICPLRLLTLGTHGYKERIFSTLHCLKLVSEFDPHVTLTIAGKCAWSHGARSVYEEIKRLGLCSRVKVLPAFTQDEAVGLYQAHHIVLHPKYLDPCPTVVMEALACGCPVVGSASGGVTELVSQESGVLIKAPVDWHTMITPTGSELAEAVVKIMSDFETYARVARARAEALFDRQHWLARHRKIFEQLIRKDVA